MSSFVSRLERAGGAAFLVLALGVFAFVGLKANVAQNRVNDCWWHIAAADAFARSGVFATDPFLRGSLPFPSFGLTEAVNAALAVLSGTDTRATWSWALAINALAALSACYACGWWASGSRWGGVLAVGAWYALAGALGLHGLGYPFLASLPLMQAFLLWFAGMPAATRWTWRRAAPAGLALGLLFDLHAWTGLFTGLCAGTVILADALALVRAGTHAGAWRAFVLGVVTLGGGGLLAAAPWIDLQLSVRSALAATNSHNLFGYRIAPLAVAGAGAVTLLLAAVAWLTRGARDARAPVLAWFALWSGIAVALAWPPLNRAIAAATSDYMSNRVLLFVPAGIATGVAARLLCAPGPAALARRLVFALACAAFAIGPLRQRAAVEWYLLRTHDLDAHWLAHLERLAPQKLRGQVVLSDPDTSYFARGLLGAQVVSLMPAMGSPAVDFKARFPDVVASLRSGRLVGVARGTEAVLVEKKRGLTEQFVEVGPAAIRAAWLASGWKLAYEDADVLLLRPPTP